METDERYLNEMACTSHQIRYSFTILPFGLQNAPAMFHRAMDVILASVPSQLALVYSDDVVVFPKSPKDHIEQVRHVF